MATQLSRLLLLAASLTTVSVANAQLTPTDSICAIGVNALKDDASSPYGIKVFYCGHETVGIINEVIRANAASSDEKIWRNIRSLLVWVRSERILSYAIELSRNVSASPAARTTAMSAIAMHTKRSYIPLSFTEAKALRPEDRSILWCYRSLPYAGPLLLNEPLGANAVERGAAAFDAVAADVSAPAELRSLASCVRSFITEVPRTLDPQRFTVEYLCDNRYKVSYTDTVSRGEFEYGVRDLRRKLPVHGPQSYQLNIPTSREPFRLYVNGRLTSETNNGRESCTAQFYRRENKPLPEGADTLTGWARFRRK